MARCPRTAFRSASVVLCCGLMVLLALSQPVAAANPHRTVYYRINGSLEQVVAGPEVTGSWRFHAKANAAGGWDGGQPVFDWEDREYSFDANFGLAETGSDRASYALRNLDWYSWGGWAHWIGQGHGKQDAPWYEFGTAGWMDLYLDGRPLAPRAHVTVALTRDWADSHGTIVLTITHPAFAGHSITMVGTVLRFQAIDFMTAP